MDTLGPAILSFIERLSSLRRLKCTSIIEKGPQSVSFIERLSSLQRFKNLLLRNQKSYFFCEKSEISRRRWRFVKEVQTLRLTIT